MLFWAFFQREQETSSGRAGQRRTQATRQVRSSTCTRRANPRAASSGDTGRAEGGGQAGGAVRRVWVRAACLRASTSRSQAPGISPPAAGRRARHGGAGARRAAAACAGDAPPNRGGFKPLCHVRGVVGLPGEHCGSAAHCQAAGADAEGRVGLERPPPVQPPQAPDSVRSTGLGAARVVQGAGGRRRLGAGYGRPVGRPSARSCPGGASSAAGLLGPRAQPPPGRAPGGRRRRRDPSGGPLSSG